MATIIKNCIECDAEAFVSYEMNHFCIECENFACNSGTVMRHRVFDCVLTEWNDHNAGEEEVVY